MSAKQLETEIGRFLSSDQPEVLCIKGKWGVGKTYAWIKFLEAATASGSLHTKNYAYVSLFGLNTLDDLRFAIVENTITSTSHLNEGAAGNAAALTSKVFDQLRKARPLWSAGLTLVGKKNIEEAVFKAAFLGVRNQLICLDDLERAGDGLKQRDVLGLVSMLKEQRGCKVALLLNDEEMEEEERREFERQLEKVVDVSLVFAPTPAEAADIALADSKIVGDSLRDRTVKLGITNIRVIKKLERLALRLEELLQPFGTDVVDQAITTVTLGGWAVLQPGEAPTLDFLRSYNRLVAGMRVTVGDAGGEKEKWRSLLSDYQFVMADDMDQAIFDGVKRGYFDEATLFSTAEDLKRRIEQDGRNNSFSKAWDLYHQDLTVDDDVVLDALAAGTKENLKSIAPVNFNAVISLFREYGRGNQADELIPLYIAAQTGAPRFFDLNEHHFMDIDELDPELVKAFAQKLASFVDDRDPGTVLTKAVEAQGWDGSDVKLLAGLTAEQFEALFENLKGPDLGRAIKLALQMSAHPEDGDAKKMRSGVIGGLRLIAAKSPLRARRIASYGVTLPKADEAGSGNAAS